MVGLVIGLIATLAIMQTLSQFEGQKRTTVGTADAQVNGSIALYSIQRQVQMAGYGLPIYDANSLKNDSPLKCSPSTIDHDADVATAKVDLFPIAITDGGVGGSDQVTVRYFPNPSGGLPVNVVTIGGSILGVDNTLGCADNDIALVVHGTTCTAARVNDADLATDTTHVTLAGPDAASMTTGPGVNYARLSCLGSLVQFTFRVNANQLESNSAPVISEIVNMQAQYGISATASSNQITQWVDAAGIWVTPTVTNRNRIRAIRLAVVSRNGLLEKTNVTPAAPISWAGGPAIDLSGTANWQQYRYRVYETIIPLRNLTWSGQWL
jgi:type IV pilus assembly protein PilW